MPLTSPDRRRHARETGERPIVLESPARENARRWPPHQAPRRIPMKTVLIVDDLSIFREPIDAVLRAQGYRTLMASNGREALGIMTSQVPDLVLLDLSMPSMDGVRVLTRMRETPVLRDVPVM